MHRTTRDTGTFTVSAATDEDVCQQAEEVLSDVIAAGAEEDIAQRLREHGGAITDTSICWEIAQKSPRAAGKSVGI